MSFGTGDNWFGHRRDNLFLARNDVTYPGYFDITFNEAGASSGMLCNALYGSLGFNFVNDAWPSDSDLAPRIQNVNHVDLPTNGSVYPIGKYAYLMSYGLYTATGPNSGFAHIDLPVDQIYKIEFNCFGYPLAVSVDCDPQAGHYQTVYPNGGSMLSTSYLFVYENIDFLSLTDIVYSDVAPLQNSILYVNYIRCWTFPVP